jgi:hypothetical protein
MTNTRSLEFPMFSLYLVVTLLAAAANAVPFPVRDP